MRRKIGDCFWPTLEAWKLFEKVHERHDVEHDVAAISRVDWEKDTATALQAAVRIADDEEDRRRTAESKATTCLLVLAAMIPIITYLEGTIWEPTKIFGAPKIITVPLLVATLAYLCAAGTWALRTLRPGTYRQIGVADLVNIWDVNSQAVSTQLIREILVSTRQNQEVINLKVSSFGMAIAFMLRALFTFTLLLAFQAVWTLGAAIAK